MSPHYALMAGYYWYWTREQANNVFHNIMCHLRVLSYRFATYKMFHIRNDENLIVMDQSALVNVEAKAKKDHHYKRIVEKDLTWHT